MATEQINNSPSGLQVSNNTFSATPPGSTYIANNVVESQKGVLEPRNGQNFASTITGSGNRKALQLTEFDGAVLVSASTDGTDDFNLGYVNSGVTTPYTSFGGLFNPVDNATPDQHRIKFAQAEGFLYWCCNNGPRALEAFDAQPRIAGLPRMPDEFLNNLQPYAGSQMPYNCNAAYRTVLRRPTSSGVSILSPPSGRLIVTNRIFIPVGSLTKASSVATATFTGGVRFFLTTGDTFVLAPGEADFPAGPYTVTGETATTFTFGITSGSATNTVAQDAQPGNAANAGFRTPVIQASLPSVAVAGDFVQLYRSVFTSDSSVDPTDELYQCAEIELQGGDIASGVCLITDQTPQSILSNPLYSNPTTGEGADQINLQPPLYRDVANFDSRTFYANTTGLHSLNLEMLGVGAANGIQDGDTITVADSLHTLTLTFKNAPSTGLEVQIVSSGLASQNIAATTTNLIQTFFVAVGPFGSNYPWAMYSASQDNNSDNGAATGIPGKILVARTDYLDDPLKITVSRPATWTPALSATVPTLTTNARVPNQLVYSKDQEAESVPPVNFLTIGAKNYAIARIVALQQGLIIFKQGDGVWSLTGSGGSYTVLRISTANIIAPDCCGAGSDFAWALTDQGPSVMRFTPVGSVGAKSRSIETVIRELVAEFPDEVFGDSFFVNYEIERRVMFYLPTGTQSNGDVQLTNYCYNTATDSWTTLDGAYSGIVTSTHFLWLGQYDAIANAQNVITKERKTNTQLDKADISYTSSITAVNVGGDPLVIMLGVGTARPGDGISQGIWATKIAALRPDIGPNTVQVFEAIPWSVAACTLYIAYPVEVQFQPSGDPIAAKKLTRMSLVYKPGEFANYFGNVTIFTDAIQAELCIPSPSLGFGSTPFGAGPFGNPSLMVKDTNPIAASHVSAAQFFPGFRTQEVWLKFKLQGVGMMLETATAPANRGK